MGRTLALLLLACATCLLAGCAAQDPDRVSTIPFNRPEPWETRGPFGGMMPENR